MRIVNNKTLESGEITWMLGEAFGQDLSIEKYPVINGQKVFKVDYSNNLNTESSTIFTNGVLPVMNIEGYTAVWLISSEGEEIYNVEKDSEIHFKTDAAGGSQRNLWCCKFCYICRYDYSDSILSNSYSYGD